MDVGMLLLRLVAGGLMIGHGTQKLFGWFGGHGVRGTAGWLESMGFRPSAPLAVATGTAEALGGAVLLTGFLTPLGAAAIAGVLFTAIVSVHWSRGMWNQNGGAEHPLMLASAALVTTFVGPGRYSIDAAIGLDLAGSAWGLGALALAAVTAGATLLWRSVLARRTASGEDASAEIEPEIEAAA